MTAISASPQRARPRSLTKTAHLDIRVEPELVARLDDWLDRQPIPPTRSAAIVHIIERFLEQEEEAGR